MTRLVFDCISNRAVNTHSAMWVVLLGLLFVGIPIARAFIVQEDESVKIRHEAPGAVTVESFRPGIDSLREWRRKVCSKIDLRATTKLWTQFNWTKGYSWASVKSLSATKYYQPLMDANSSTRAVHQLANITAYGVVLRRSRNILAPSFLTMRVATFDNVVRLIFKHSLDHDRVLALRTAPRVDV